MLLVLLLIFLAFFMSTLPAPDARNVQQYVNPHAITDDYGRKEYRKLDCPEAKRSGAFTEQDRKACEKWVHKRARKKAKKKAKTYAQAAEEALLNGFRQGSQGSPFRTIHDD